jgi:hypothetical protein
LHIKFSNPLVSQPQVIKFTAEFLAHGRWFCPGTPPSSATKTGRHDIAEILLKVALKHQKSNQSINELVKSLKQCLRILIQSLFFFNEVISNFKVK